MPKVMIARLTTLTRHATLIHMTEKPRPDLVLHSPASSAENETHSAAELTGRPTSHVRRDIDSANSAHDFDFLHGQWRVRNRRLLRPLTGSDVWEEFEATSVVRPLWDGDGNIEEWDAQTPDGPIRALSLQLHDPGSGQWRLHWATSRDGRVGVPTVGTFQNGVGEFHAQEDFAGRTILLRITWEDRGADACRWEQCFSENGGGSWERNWTMDFARVK